MHPTVKNAIRFALQREDSGFTKETRSAWRHILEAWESANRQQQWGEWFHLKDLIKLDGWSASDIRELSLQLLGRISQSREVGAAFFHL